MTATGTTNDLPFDPDALREKYRVERDKRMRSDGIDQYQALTGEFSKFLDDTHVDQVIARDPIEEELDVVVIGGGFSGLSAGAQLKKAGIGDVRIVEGGGDFGGTWYWNQYPGVQCDIESYIYLPMLEELGYMPKLKYSYGPEIQQHACNIARHFGLDEGALFQTRVTHIDWNADTNRWTVRTNRDDRLQARFVVVAAGPLSRPKLPGIPGIQDFGGHTFHTSRWDFAYTGGDTNGGLDKLGDKKVGVIGTGATAIQCIPHLGEAAEHLFVFQRTPSSVDARHNRPTDPEWAANLEPGWQEERIANFSMFISGTPVEEDLVSDGWTDIIRKTSVMFDRSEGESSPEDIERMVEYADFEKMEEIRARVASIVSDPATAEALKPWYRMFCKRPCFHDDYLPTFERDNVTLVDTDGRGVERITKDGVVVAGKEYPLDCLVFATGFEVGTDFSRRAAIEIRGTTGETLAEHWKEEVRTFHGLTTDGFPNLFLMGGLQSGVTPNFTELYNEQSQHIAYIVDQTLKQPEQVFEASQEAVADWVRIIKETAYKNTGFAESCTPGYYNNEGKPGVGPGWFGGSFGGGAQAFFALLREWRAQGRLEGMHRR